MNYIFIFFIKSAKDLYKFLRCRYEFTFFPVCNLLPKYFDQILTITRIRCNLLVRGDKSNLNRCYPRLCHPHGLHAGEWRGKNRIIIDDINNKQKIRHHMYMILIFFFRTAHGRGDTVFGPNSVLGWQERIRYYLIMFLMVFNGVVQRELKKK